jgi:hypothetical protein
MAGSKAYLFAHWSYRGLTPGISPGMSGEEAG